MAGDVKPIIEHFVHELPESLRPGEKYFVLNANKLRFRIYAGSLEGNAVEAEYITIEDLFKPVYEYGLVGALDGINDVFSISESESFIPRTTRLHINGVRQYLGDDYEEVGTDRVRIYRTLKPTSKLILDYLTTNNNL